MFERMLNKEAKPTFEEMLAYCGDSGALWLEFEDIMRGKYDLQTLIRFPYGKSYGWGVKYSQKAQHICDVFAEAGAFYFLFRMDDKDIDRVKNELSAYSQKICDEKYPCSAGGWINYRVTEKNHLTDVVKLIFAKVKPQKLSGESGNR